MPRVSKNMEQQEDKYRWLECELVQPPLGDNLVLLSKIDNVYALPPSNSTLIIYPRETHTYTRMFSAACL